jgi:intracellular septation protein
MYRPIIKFIADFGPLFFFFFIYYNNDNNLKLAIPPFIIATLISLIVIYILEKKLPVVPLMGGVIIVFFGGLTLYFDNKVFFYMKPTIVNMLFAGILLFGKFFTKKPLLKIFFQAAIELKSEGWKILNNRWIGFFIFVAILNEIVWRIYCPEQEYIWVNFKVWGLLPISLLFAASQISIINKYKLKK